MFQIAQNPEDLFGSLAPQIAPSKCQVVVALAEWRNGPEALRLGTSNLRQPERGSEYRSSMVTGVTVHAI